MSDLRTDIEFLRLSYCSIPVNPRRPELVTDPDHPNYNWSISAFLARMRAERRQHEAGMADVPSSVSERPEAGNAEMHSSVPKNPEARNAEINRPVSENPEARIRAERRQKEAGMAEVRSQEPEPPEAEMEEVSSPVPVPPEASSVEEKLDSADHPVKPPPTKCKKENGRGQDWPTMPTKQVPTRAVAYASKRRHLLETKGYQAACKMKEKKRQDQLAGPSKEPSLIVEGRPAKQKYVVFDVKPSIEHTIGRTTSRDGETESGKQDLVRPDVQSREWYHSDSDRSFHMKDRTKYPKSHDLNSKSKNRDSTRFKVKSEGRKYVFLDEKRSHKHTIREGGIGHGTTGVNERRSAPSVTESIKF